MMTGCRLQMWKLRKQQYSKHSSVLFCSVAACDLSDKLGCSQSSIFKLDTMNESLHAVYKSSDLYSAAAAVALCAFSFRGNMLSSLTLSPLSPPRGGFVCLKPQTAPLSFTAFLLLCSLFPIYSFILHHHHSSLLLLSARSDL